MLLGGLIELGPRVAGARLVVTDNVRHFSALRAHGIRVLDSAACAAELAGRG